MKSSPIAAQGFGARQLKRAVLMSGVLLGSALPTFAANYYVSPTGNDSNNGTSTSTPWQNISKVNSTTFAAGDRIYFQGGQTFNGSITFADESGTSTNPIVVSSYGTGRATINGGTSHGIFVHNRGGFSISNLNIVSSGTSTNTNSGIIFYNDLTGNVKLNYIRVDSVDVSGFRKSGIEIGAYPSDGSRSGYNDVRITNSDSHDNLDAGIQAYGYFTTATPVTYSHQNFYIGNCKTYNNTGIANKGSHSGNGIVLGSVDGVTIERCVAYNNGANSNFSGGGPVGIWVWDTNNATIQFNEAYNNRTQTLDGGGFDLDGGVTNSVMQYNYSHGNDGAGYLLYQFGGANPFYNNIVRYNISENDGRRGSYGGIYTGGGVNNSEIYNNTIYTASSPSASPAAIRVTSGSSNMRFRNNIVVTTGGARLVEIASGQTGVVFQGNAYWSSGGTFNIHSSGTTYNSLGAWRTATNQEKNGATNTGLEVDPKLTNAGNGGTIGNANNLSTLNAYKLQSTSPLINAGLNLTTSPWNLSVGSRDFYGASLPQNGAYDIGAHEAAPTTIVNLVSNPSFDAENFDTQTPSGWSEWSSIGGVGAGFTEAYGGSKSGARHGTHWLNSAYNMYTYQTKTGLTNGLYTLRVWAKSGGGQTTCQIEAKDFGGTQRQAALPVSSTYQLVEIKDINVTNGQCTFGFWSQANAGNWAYFDDVEFFKQ